MLDQNTSYQSSESMNEKKWIKIFLLIFLIILAITFALGVFLYKYHLMHTQANKDTLLTPISIPTVTPASIPTQPLNFKNSLQTIIDSHQELNFGISFIDLKSENKTDINGDKIFAGASTTKVLIACLLLSQIEAGKHSLDQPLDGKTVGEHLKLMINRSDNDSWESLMKFIGFQYQKPYAKSIGINSYDVINNKISSNDMAYLLAELYDNKLLNISDTKLLLSYMQHTNDDDLIPQAVPDNIAVYHKYGSYNGALDDSAIIDNGKNPFSLAIYTATTSAILSYNQKIMIFHEIVTAVENANGIQTNAITP